MGSYWYTVCSICNQYTESTLKYEDKPICEKCNDDKTLILTPLEDRDNKIEQGHELKIKIDEIIQRDAQIEKKEEIKKTEEVKKNHNCIEASCRLQCLKCLKYKLYHINFKKSKVQCDKCCKKNPLT